MAAYYCIAVIGLCMLMGYAGQISLGQAGFFAIGGYTTAALTTLNLIKFNGEGLIKFLYKIGSVNNLLVEIKLYFFNIKTMTVIY